MEWLPAKLDAESCAKAGEIPDTPGVHGIAGAADLGRSFPRLKEDTLVRMRIALFVLITCSPAWGQDGAFLFQINCASCHRPQSGTRAPLPDALRQMSRQSILAALETGKMKFQGSLLKPEERTVLADFLGVPDVPGSSPQASFCSADARPSNGDFASQVSWNGWGVDLANSRFQPARAAGLDGEQVPRLKLRWAFGLPRATTAFGQPTIVAGRLFLGSADGTVYSLDAKTGCIWWTYKALGTVRTAVTLDPKGRAAYFGDMEANVYAVNAATGALLWRTQVDQHLFAVITGAPKLHAGRLYVPLSSAEEVPAASSKYECCTFRGSLVALKARNGKLLWKTYTISEPPAPTGRNAAGTRMWGPSGAAIWGSPTLDPRHKVIYVGTGDNYSRPATQYSDAVLALDMRSGKILWAQQMTPQDSWNLACINPDKTNCPETPGGDFDIGASPILRSLPGDRRLLIVGQKSGIVHGLDPDRKGKIVWQTRLGHGGTLGGIEWGGAADNEFAYFGLSDLDHSNPEAGGGLFALRIATGEKVWYAPPPRPACLGQPGCNPAQMAPVTLVSGAVFSGSMDGHLRAYNTADGTVIWDYDTLQEFQTVNGVKARGGSLNATGPTVAAGMLYVNSGYGMLAGMPGNAVLAFSVQGK